MRRESARLRGADAREVVVVKRYELRGDDLVRTDGPYVCVGYVRGWCGLRHDTVDAAEDCVDADARACADGGGAYSDRDVYDGSQLPRTVGGSYYLPAGVYVPPVFPEVSDDAAEG